MLAASGVDEDLFEDVVFETFTCSSTDGREVELLPGGEDIEVAILKEDMPDALTVLSTGYISQPRAVV